MQVEIKQQELEEIHELERDITPKIKRIDELKQNVKVLLIHKMPIELGRFDARLLKRFHRHVTWRQAVVDNLGPHFAEEYKKKFPVQMFCEVAVEEHATLLYGRTARTAWRSTSLAKPPAFLEEHLLYLSSVGQLTTDWLVAQSS